MKKLFIAIFTLCFAFLSGKEPVSSLDSIRAEYQLKPKVYPLEKNAPIDVVIPCIEGDLYTLPSCIEGIRKNGVGVRRIIIVSSKPLIEPIDGVEWFDEAEFPFTKDTIAYEIFQSVEKAQEFVKSPNSRIGWIFQQLLKLYAPFVIPDISSNVLVLDADIVFLSPTEFISSEGRPFFTVRQEHHLPYFAHMQRVLPYLKRIYPAYSGIAHHMLLQKEILSDFFSQIAYIHENDPWKVFCRCIDISHVYRSSLSEYEMYFTFSLLNSNQPIIRSLPYKDVPNIDSLDLYKKEKLSFICCHHYIRKIKNQ